MFQIAGQQGEQVGAHLRRHVRQQGCQSRFQRGDVPCAECGEVERATLDAMDDQGVLVGFEAADQRVDGAVAVAENMFDLAADFLRVLDCRLRVVGEAGTCLLYTSVAVLRSSSTLADEKKGVFCSAACTASRSSCR